MASVKVQGNVTVSYDGHDLTPYLNTSSLEGIVNKIDTTNFASTGTETMAGVQSWNIEIGGNWDFTLDGYLGPDILSPPDEDSMKTLIVSIGKTSAKAIYTWATNSFISNYRIEARDPTSAVGWSGSLAVSGNPIRTTG